MPFLRFPFTFAEAILTYRMQPHDNYTQRLQELQAAEKKRQQKKSVFSLLRFGTIAALIAGWYFLASFGWPIVLSTVILLLIIFVRLVYRDLANRTAIKHLQQLIQINFDEIAATEGRYFHFAPGNDFMPKEHPYAADLDIFGHASLYQFINRTTSDMGARELADWLLEPATANVIRERQEAVKELKDKIHWRQEIQAFGRETTIRQTTVDHLQHWLQAPALFLPFAPWKWLRYLLPVIILTLVGITIAGLIPLNALYFFLFIYAVLAYQLNKLIAPLHNQLSRIVDELEALSLSMEQIEKESFKAPLNRQLQAGFSAANQRGSAHIRSLKGMLNRLDLRYNIVLSAPLNVLLLWNLQQVLDLEKWKQQHASQVPQWFKHLGIFEAMHSISTLHYNHPEWCFPELKPTHFSMEASNLGHPLIHPDKRVNNFITMKQRGEIMLVTGSNMAGKSTYLRSVGVNVVLAMAGAPVCAQQFSISPVQLMSSMRVADNLEESTSTFYAELKKLKTIIDQVNEGAPVFILLDEILRGTNSLDRHTGSDALIRQLIKKQAAAIIATHDLALAEIKAQFPEQLHNYHFDAQVSGEELFFDYRLKPGICQSLNASILMKKIGIEMEG